MSVFSKAIESILKSFGKEAGKASKATQTQKSTTNNAIMPNQNPQRQDMQANPKNPSKSTTPAQKQIHKEQRGIYNVTYNGKNATIIKQDLDSLQEAILYERGRENPKNHKGYGAKHIFKHTQNDKELGFITKDELLNLGQNLRQYLAKHKEPFIDKNGSRIYEWENEAGNRFRAVIGSVGKDSATTAESKDLSLPMQRI